MFCSVITVNRNNASGLYRDYDVTGSGGSAGAKHNYQIMHRFMRFSPSNILRYLKWRFFLMYKKHFYISL